MPKRTKKSEQVDEATTQAAPEVGAHIDYEARHHVEPKPKKGRKQGELPGMESPKHPELDALVEMPPC